MSEPLTKEKVSFEFLGSRAPRMMDMSDLDACKGRALVHLDDVRSAVEGFKHELATGALGLGAVIDRWFPIFKEEE